MPRGIASMVTSFALASTALSTRQAVTRTNDTVAAQLPLGEVGHAQVESAAGEGLAQAGQVERADLHAPALLGGLVARFSKRLEAGEISFVLEGIVSQTLVPRANGTGRVLAGEVMVPTPAIRNLIREDKIHQIYSQMQIGQGQHQMQTMNQALCALYLKRQITLEEALEHADSRNNLSLKIRLNDNREVDSPDALTMAEHEF